MRELALFAGSGGGILGGKLLGWTTVCAVEINPYCQRVLMQRQDDGILEPFPIWGDVKTFAGRPWRGLVDVISGGFPCQDISAAGSGAGITGERSGLWSEMARIIREVRPQHVLVENSPMLTSRGLGVVLGDLAKLRYDARWGVFSAAGVGADHLRRRIWIRAYAIGVETRGKISGEHSQGRRPDVRKLCQNVADATSAGLSDGSKTGVSESGAKSGDQMVAQSERRSSTWWATEPDVGRVAHGVASRVDRLRAIGNGQVPAVVVRAWEALKP